MIRLLAVLAALLLGACASKKDGFESDSSSMKIYGAFYEDFFAEAPADESAYFVGMSTKKAADGTAFGLVRANRRLYAPFEVLVVAGLAPGEDQAGFGADAQICMELDERASFSPDIATLLWVLVCAKREGGGLRVRAQDQFVQLGSVLLPDTDAAILVIRHDGTDLIFETGPASLTGAADGGLTEIARLDDWLPAVAGDALIPSMGTSFLAHPAEILFSHAQVVGNGEAPGALSDVEATAFGIGPAVDATVRAFELLGGPAPAPEDAKLELVDAQGLLEASLADIEALEPDKAVKKARKAVKSAIKAVVAAIERIDDGKPVTKVLKKVGPGAKLAMRAIQALDPLPEH